MYPTGPRRKRGPAIEQTPRNEHALWRSRKRFLTALSLSLSERLLARRKAPAHPATDATPFGLRLSARHPLRGKPLRPTSWGRSGPLRGEPISLGWQG